METCPKCNAPVTESAPRCGACGLGLTEVRVALDQMRRSLPRHEVGWFGRLLLLLAAIVNVFAAGVSLVLGVIYTILFPSAPWQLLVGGLGAAYAVANVIVFMHVRRATA